MGKLDQKVALVTGGSRGIGAAIAWRLAADDASVAITYTRGREPAEQLVKEIAAAGGRAIALQADSADSNAVTRSVDETAKQLGGLDILVNNAGIGIFKPFEQFTDEDINQSFDVNVRGYMIATRAALKYLKSGGRIINIGSIVGERMMFQGMVLYSSTKGAVRMFTQALSRELGPRGITVNAVAPGPIDTEANPAAGPAADEQLKAIALGRFGHVDEVAPLVSYLASAESGYSTGSTFTVDGGVNA